MAGIGFELRRLMKPGSFSSLLRAYGYAGLIGSGPWVLSIVGVLLIGLLAGGRGHASGRVPIDQFLVTVTWLTMSSLVLTGPLQLMLSRFVADKLFDNRRSAVLPNLLGALSLTALVAGGLAIVAAFALFGGQSLLYRLLLVTCEVTLCGCWILTVLLSSLKAYRSVLLTYLAGYGASVGISLLLGRYGLEGYLAGFWAGQAVLFFLMLATVLRSYPGERLVSLQFLRSGQSFRILLVTGLCYNLGIWADKLLFWLNPAVSQPVIGPLRASVVYDLPIFLSYLSIIPGMAVFLLRMETDFAESYQNLFAAVRGGDTLAHIERLKDEMVVVVRQGIYEIFKVQGLVVAGLVLWGDRLLAALDISPLYVPLFLVDVVSAGVQVVLLSVLNVFFYLDKRAHALLLTALFLIANSLLTRATFSLGPAFYGYGFAAALTVTTLLGLFLLGRSFDNLEYETFMHQR